MRIDASTPDWKTFRGRLGPGTTYDPQRVLDLLRRIAALDPRVHLLTTDEFFAAINPAYMLDLARNTLSEANATLISRETTEQSRSAEDNYQREEYDRSLEFSRRSVSGATETLEIGVSPAGSGILDRDVGAYLLPKGSSITTTQIPGSGYKFDYWLLDGARVGPDSSITLRMNVHHNLTALYSVSVTTVPTPTTTSSTTTTSVPPPPVPGFPVESILAGLVGGVAVLTLLRRRRKRPILVQGGYPFLLPFFLANISQSEVFLHQRPDGASPAIAPSNSSARTILHTTIS